jgi:hypothetical protein
VDVRRRKEARKAKLRESAAKMKQSGKIEPSFQDSKYSLPEDATTPNMRGREYSDRYQLPGRINCRDWVQVLVCGTLCALWKATVAAVFPGPRDPRAMQPLREAPSHLHALPDLFLLSVSLLLVSAVMQSNVVLDAEVIVGTCFLGGMCQLLSVTS